MDKILFEDHFNRLSSILEPIFEKKIKILFESSYIQNDEIQTYKPEFISSILSAISDDSEQLLISRQLLIIGFILKNWATLNSSVVDLKLQEANKAYLKRLLSMVIDGNESLDNDDVFWKELAIARLQFFPIHSGVVEFYSGFGLKQGLGKNLLQTISFINFIIKFGRKPYYQVHTHTPIIHNFTSAGWAYSYYQIAEMLRVNNDIQGVIRGSWFFDPEVKRISPRLSYLQDLPLQNGAKLFCTGKDESGSAFTKSKYRLKLYNEGQYVPMNYLLVWPRAAIISWSEQYKDENR